MVNLNRHGLWKNEEIIERVKGLWKDHSAAEIAAILSNDTVKLTRNSVIGFLNRSGLAAMAVKRPHKEKNESLRTPAQVSDDQSQRLREKRLLRAPTIAPTPFAVSDATVEPLHVSLHDLRSEHCRYPYGDDPASVTYCGHSKVRGHSWCVDHLGVVRNMEIKRARRS